jgi:hypothetical protein
MNFLPKLNKSFLLLSFGTVLIGMSSVAMAAPITGGTVAVGGSVAFAVTNLSGNYLLAPSPPSASDVNTALSGGTAGTPSSALATQSFSLSYNGSPGTALQVTVNNTANNVATLATSPELKGAAAGNTTAIPYAINYTPCGSSTVYNLANQCNTTGGGINGCAIPYANSNKTICTGQNGSLSFTVTPQADMPADTYTGSTELIYSLGA